MARAAALSAIEDLPADMRRFVESMLAEHQGQLARDRAVQELIGRVRETWRQWPELGWAASAQACAVDELPRYAAWRKEGTALLAEGRRRLAGRRRCSVASPRHAGRATTGLAAAVANARAHVRASTMRDGSGPGCGRFRTRSPALLDERQETGSPRAPVCTVPGSLLPPNWRLMPTGRRVATRLSGDWHGHEQVA